MKEKWLVHRLMTGELCRMLRRSGRGKAIPGGLAGLRAAAIKGLFDVVPVGVTLETQLLVDEHGWMREGNRMLFPASKSLVEMLLRARFRLEGREIKFPYRSFILAAPAGLASSEGVSLRPCLVLIDDRASRRSDTFSFIERYLGMKPSEIDYRTEFPENGQKTLTLVMSDGAHWTRCTLPFDKLSSALETDGRGLKALLGSYRGILAGGLSDGELDAFALAARVVCGLAVYLEARPDSLRPGLPGGLGRPDTPDRCFLSGADNHVCVEAPPGMGAGGSKSTHYRTWFFRSYPKRRDGSRKEGVVFVSDTIVNAEEAETGTVVE